MSNERGTITFFQFIVGIYFYTIGLIGIAVAVTKEKYLIATIMAILTLTYILFSIKYMKEYIVSKKTKNQNK
ncbi:MAG: hypothetical protein RR409_15155 [Clostridium sp.]